MLLPPEPGSTKLSLPRTKSRVLVLSCSRPPASNSRSTCLKRQGPEDRVFQVEPQHHVPL
jgi:hypothetical protein